MRLALFSDVHGNIEALDSVLTFFQDQSIDQYAFMGDAVGYGANPNAVCDRIREVADFAVVGNHDAAVCGRMNYSQYYEAARHSLDWCRGRLSRQNMLWLKGLPYTQDLDHVQFCHGAPVEPELFDYLFNVDQAYTVLRAGFDSLAPVTFIGHSHLTIVFRIQNGEILPVVESQITCEPDAKYIITVGSVGQPRDRDPRACCGIFDTETNAFTFHRLEYDILSQRRKIIDAGLARVFGDRLLEGV